MLYGNKVIALCTTKVSDIQTSRFVSALNSRLVENSASLLVYSMNSELTWDERVPPETSVYDAVNYSITDAVIIMDQRIKSRVVTKKIIAEAKSHNLPVFVIDGKYDEVPCICFDYEKGFEKIVRHVFEHHTVKKPHFMAGMIGNDYSEERIGVFQKLLAENNIPFDESMVSYGDFWEGPAGEAAQALIDSGNIPDAMICANDAMAISVCRVFQNNGIRIPEDVIITGFDGLDEIYFTTPKISSVCCDSSVIADTAYDVLQDCFAGKEIDKMIYVVPTLIPNSSCGCEEYMDSQVETEKINDNFYHYQEDLQALFTMAHNIQMCNSLGEASEHLHNYLLHEMFIVVNKSCTAREVDSFSDDVNMKFESEMYMIYNSEKEDTSIRLYDRSKAKENLDNKKLIEKKCPIVFNSLVFMDKILGYLCFHFASGNVADLSRIFPITTAVSTALGGYMMMRYQKYFAAKVEEIGKYDPLTQLCSIKAFKEEYNKLAVKSYGRTISVIAADLDRLKYINDNFGHDSGNQAIQTAAEVFKASCPFGTLCVRYGGDELVAVIFGEYSGDQIIDRINDGLSQYNAKAGNAYKVTLSCGFYKATFTRDFDFDALVKKAEEKMYEIKKIRRLKAGILK